MFAVLSISLFISDSRRSYTAMVDSMKRHAENNPSVIVQNSSGSVHGLLNTDPVGGTYATRDTVDLDDIVLPTDP